MADTAGNDAKSASRPAPMSHRAQLTLGVVVWIVVPIVWVTAVAMAIWAVL